MAMSDDHVMPLVCMSALPPSRLHRHGDGASVEITDHSQLPRRTLLIYQTRRTIITPVVGTDHSRVLAWPEC